MSAQGTDEWRQKRLGKVTASRVADIMRRGKTKDAPSMSRARYLGELVAERLTGVQVDGYKSADMEHGTATEAEAIEVYSFTVNHKIEAIDFVDHPSIAMAGCSPDRLVGDDGLVEAKCPAIHTHIATLLGAPIEPDYMKQMYWQMACTGRQWCDWISYDARLPEDMRMEVRRVHRDETAIAEITDAVVKFLADVDRTVADLTAKYRRAAA